MPSKQELEDTENMIFGKNRVQKSKVKKYEYDPCTEYAESDYETYVEIVEVVEKLENLCNEGYEGGRQYGVPRAREFYGKLCDIVREFKDCAGINDSPYCDYSGMVEMLRRDYLDAHKEA